jgi:hypothetical protein
MTMLSSAGGIDGKEIGLYEGTTLNAGFDRTSAVPFFARTNSSILWDELDSLLRSA